MAISYIRPLLLLIASLFLLPFLRAADFEYCYEGENSIGTVTQVEISPNPVRSGDSPTIKIFISATKSLDKGNVELSFTFEVFDKTAIEYIKVYNLCEVAQCPIKPGTNFVLTLPEVKPFVYKPYPKYFILLREYEDGEPSLCLDIEIPSTRRLDSA